MLFSILYLENSDKSRFLNLKKCIKNYYVLNKAVYPRTVTEVQILLLNHQHNYNSNRQYQYQGVVNQLMFAQSDKTRYDEGETKYDKQKARRNLDHITCNDFGEKGHYTSNSECSTQKKFKEVTEAFRKMKQYKYGNKSPDGVV